MSGWPPPSRPVDDDGTLDDRDTVAEFYDADPSHVEREPAVDSSPELPPSPAAPKRDRKPKAKRTFTPAMMPGQASAVVVILALAAALLAWLLLMVIGAPSAGPGRALIAAAVALSVSSTGMSRGPTHTMTALSVVTAVAAAALSALNWWVCGVLLIVLLGLGFSRGKEDEVARS